MIPTLGRLAVRLVRRAGGFTFLEFLIVLTVCAILVSVAVPSYREYTIRSRVVEGLEQAEAAKMLVAGNLARGTSSLSAGFVSPPPNRVVSSMTISDDGAITIRYGEEAGNGSLVLNPRAGRARLVAGQRMSEPLVWQCNAAGSIVPDGGEAGTLAPKYAPAQCR